MKASILDYSILDILKLIIDFVYTKIFFSQAKIVRLPITIRGKKSMSIASGFVTGRRCRIECFTQNKEKTLFIGKNVELNDNVHITASKKVVIHDNVLIASNVYISDTIHGSYSGIDSSDPETPPNERKLSYKPVEIFENVWIGDAVSILPGVTIGKGSIIGANSVVTKDIPENTIAAGVPATLIKQYSKQEKQWIKI